MPLPPDRSLAMSLTKPTTHSILQRLAAPLALVVASQVPIEAEAASVDRALPTGLGAPVLPVWAVEAPQASSNRIDGLSVEELDDGTTVLRLQGSRKPTFNVYRLSDPDRLVVDIAGSEPGKVVPHVPLDTWACGRVTVDGVAERDATLVRLVVELKREASYIVLPKGEELVITVTPREIAPEAYFARRSAQQRRAEIERSSRDARALEAEARALSHQARAKSAEADRKVAEASERAEEARAAEQRAKALDALQTDTAKTRAADIHGLRREYATALAAAGTNVYEAMALAGHSDPRTHARYVKLTGRGALKTPKAALPKLDGQARSRCTARAGPIVSSSVFWNRIRMPSITDPAFFSVTPAGLEPALPA